MWGSEAWGSMLWGGGTPAPVPLTSPLGIGLLVTAFVCGAVFAMRGRLPRVFTWIAVSGLVLVPLAAVANTLVIPHVFVNATIADADEVNANFGALVIESNDQDSRIGQLETDVSTHTGEASSLYVDSSGDTMSGALQVPNLLDPGGSNFFDGGCGDNAHVASIDSTGAITCAANSADISGISVGVGLIGGGTSGAPILSHADTSGAPSLDNSNGTVIQDVFVDGFGHVTALGSANLDSRYYTESESSNNFVNETGDSMTGSLTIDPGSLSVKSINAYVYTDTSSTTGYAGIWMREQGANKWYMLNYAGSDSLQVYNYTHGSYAYVIDGPTNQMTVYDEANFSSNVDVSGTVYAGYERLVGSSYALTTSASGTGLVNSGTAYYGTTSVSCSVGKTIIGGGCYCNSSYNCFVIRSYPSSTSAWSCSAAASTSSYALTPYALCARLGN